MAIAKINKIEIIGLQKDKEELLALLQKLGILELITVKSQDTDIVPKTVDSGVDLLAIEEAISFLASFKEKAAGFLDSIVTFKPLVYQQQLQEVIAAFNYQNILTDLSSLRNQLKNISLHKDRLIQEKQLLSPWRKLHISLEELHYQQHCGIILGILNTRDYLHLLEDAEKNKFNLYLDIVHQDKANTYLIIFYLREEFEQLGTLLKSYHFNFITLTRHKCTIEERLFEINREVLVLQDQIQGVKDKIKELSDQQFKLMVIYDYLYNRRKTQEADKSLSQQQFTFTLAGWVRQKDKKLLEEFIASKFKDIAIFISEPEQGEDIPVILDNKPIIQPFEFITGIYGMPKYHEIDPTPYLAPFFFLYFGFCVSDAGYGFILVLVSWFILKKFSRQSGIPPKAGKMGPQGTRFWKMFLFCGISTIVIGALTGSWFGNMLDLLGEANKIFLPLKKFKDSLVLLDPLKEPTKLLGIALSLGIIQVWFGNIVAAIGNIKNKRYLDIILDQIPMLTLLFGLTGLGLVFLKLLGTTHISLFKNSTLLAAIALTFTQGRSEKGIGSKLFYGIYNLYNALSGYLSDILSYSRLWALGLVTGVMASTINLIAVQFSQILVSIIPFMSKVIVIKIIVSALVIAVIFILGHTISFLINLIGAFVHPLRLQFVEFFSKFFKSGGSTFKPFKLETKYININQ